MLNFIRLTNFKRHESLDVDFGAGLNIIFGDNYKGKTTILHGVLYALGGPTLIPGGAALVDRLDDEGKTHKATVELGFTVSGTQYSVTRSSSKVNLYRRDKDALTLIANSAKNVGAELESLLGFPIRRLTQMKYAEQGNMKALLTLGAGELNKIVEEVAEIEVVNQALVGCSSRLSEVNAVLDSLSLPDTEEIKALEKQLADLFSLQDQAVAAIEAAGRRVAGAEGAYDTARRELSNAMDQVQKAEDHNRKVDQQERRKVELEAALEPRKEAHAAVAAEVNELAAKLTALGEFDPARKDALAAEIRDMESELAVLQQDAARRAQVERQRGHQEVTLDENRLLLNGANVAGMAFLGAEAEGGEDPLELNAEILQAFKEEHQTLAQDAESAKVAVATLSAQIAALDKAQQEGVCGACHRAFEDHNPEQIQAERAALVEKMQLARVTHSTLVPRIAEFEERGSRLVAARDALVKAEADLAKTLQELADLPEASTEEGPLRERILSARDKLDAERDREREFTGLRERLARKQVEAKGALERVADTEDSLRALVIEERMVVLDLTELQNGTHNLNVALIQAQGELREQQGKRDLATSQIQGVEATLARHRATLEKSAELVKKRDTALRLRKYLKDNRDRFLEEVWNGLMAQASSFVATCTNGDIRSIVRTEDEFLFDEGRAKAMPITAASGAQKTFMGLGVQTALAGMMNTGFNCLMLDEPAADLRRERSLELIAGLKASGQQVIVISHSMEDAALADTMIEVA